MKMRRRKYLHYWRGDLASFFSLMAYLNWLEDQNAHH